MEAFSPSQEPDEGYSEHPLYSSSTADSTLLVPPTHLRDSSEFLAWLSPRLSSLTVPQRTQLAMSILNELPTTVIAEIVLKQLNPRLYIDFVEYLPTEICLKILGYLDPLSLINVARSCRGWYDLALDGKLWEKLFYMEGWRAITHEILTAENRINAHLAISETIHPQRLQSDEYGHTHKKRAVSDPAPSETETDEMDIDRDERDERRDAEMSGTSLFGGGGVSVSTSSTKSAGSVVQHLGHLMMHSPSPMPEPASEHLDIKGKSKAAAESSDSRSPPALVLPNIPRSSLWTYDAKNNKYKINWQYLYMMRRRLEYNWEAGKFTNFQLPHPHYPREGHKECVYSLQYDSQYLVSGSRDRTIRIWDLRTRRLVRRPLIGHAGSVLCLQFDSDPEEDIIVSGSSDSNIIIWKFSTGEKLQVLKYAHTESVLNVKFDKRILVTCSKDRNIKIFNRRALRPGELGYGDTSAVSPVPVNVRNYDYDDSPLNHLPIKPPFTQIGCLEGHGAAVNAVQIYGNEVVSASGDRHIKVWDWPNQICRRTFLGHGKGIACIQYDGRRIISGSSDNEVKVFDRETGLEVATLRGHGNLVRTVQAGFGDLPNSVEDDRIAAKTIDNEYFAAVRAGTLVDSHTARGKAPNAGGRRPEDITAYGAKLPPGGGGGPYGRIVSGSYDQTVIIWRRNKEGKWKNVHTLRQEDAAAAAVRQMTLATATSDPPSAVPSQLVSQSFAGASSALPSLHHNARPVARDVPPASPASAPPTMQSTTNLTHVEHPIHATITPQTSASYLRLIETCVPQGPAALRDELNSFPTMLAYYPQIQAAIDQQPHSATRAQLRQVLASAVQRAQLAQNRIRESVQQAMADSSATANQSSSRNPSTVTQNTTSQQSPTNQSATPQARAYGQNAQNSNVPIGTLTPAASTTLTGAAGSSALPAASNGTPLQSVMIQQAQQLQALAQAHSQTQPAASQPATHGAPPAAPTPIAAHHPHIGQAEAQAPRVFKLQFDAHKIICCSQTPTIVGWDFCNGDSELEEVVRFFAPIE
ncbi:hypothetical protein BX600DRAFT_132985 [Xylariales sp. PMI_506]|nr:hypothetical protein BX600DRAFT_132985 [Xylariales sp. PMI_506]